MLCLRIYATKVILVDEIDVIQCYDVVHVIGVALSHLVHVKKNYFSYIDNSDSKPRHPSLS